MMQYREMAQKGYHLIRDAIMGLLAENPDGLSNAEIVKQLDLHSEFQGKHNDYLTWSILGNMIKEGVIITSGYRKNRVFKINRM